LPSLSLSAKLVDGNGVETLFSGSDLTITNLTAATDYWLRVESIGAIPVDYDVQFVLAAGADGAEPNNTPVQAYSLGQLPNVDRINGLTVNPSDPDWFALNLPSAGGSNAAITLRSNTPGAVLTLSARDANGADIGYNLTLPGNKGQDSLSLNL